MTSYDPDKATSFVTAISAGASNDVAALHISVPLEDVREWMLEQPEFKQRIDKARADLEILAVGHIRRQALEDTAAAQWMAERTHGDAELERLRALTT